MPVELPGLPRVPSKLSVAARATPFLELGTDQAGLGVANPKDVRRRRHWAPAARTDRVVDDLVAPPPLRAARRRPGLLLGLLDGGIR